MTIRSNDEFTELFKKQSKSHDEYQALSQYLLQLNEAVDGSIVLIKIMKNYSEQHVPSSEDISKFFQEISKLNLSNDIYEWLYLITYRNRSNPPLNEEARMAWLAGFNPPPSDSIHRTIKVIDALMTNSLNKETLDKYLKEGINENIIITALKNKRDPFYDSMIITVLMHIIGKAKENDSFSLKFILTVFEYGDITLLRQLLKLNPACLEKGSNELPIGFALLNMAYYDYDHSEWDLQNQEKYKLIFNHAGEININHIISPTVHSSGLNIQGSESLLSDCIKQGHIPFVEYILNRNDVDVNIPDGKPLRYALNSYGMDKYKIISMLLAKGAKFPTDEDVDKHFVNAIAIKRFDLCEQYYQSGARMSEKMVLSLLKSAKEQGDSTLYSFVVKFGNLDKDKLLLHALFNKDFDTAAKLLDSGVAIPDDFDADYFFKIALKAKRLDICEKFYQRGIKPSAEFARKKILSAYHKKDSDLYNNLIKWGKLNTDSLFANAIEFRKSAICLDQSHLATPYNNGSTPEQWKKQRAIVLFSDNSTQTIQPNFIYGLDTAVRLARQNGDKLITPAEVAQADNIPIEQLGKVNVQALEKNTGKKVLKVIYRPNHDDKHSIRAAALVPSIHQFMESPYVNVEQLQLMLLYSVCGREDETGFNSSVLGRELYQSYRAVSALEFLNYVLRNWDRHYKNVFKNIDAVYQAALIVEMMGYSPPLTQNLLHRKPPFLIYTLMQKGSLQEVKNAILQYPNGCGLKNYTDEYLNALLPQHKITDPYNTASADNLSYMNLAHGDELLRCYLPGDPGSAQSSGTIIPTIIGDYEIISDYLTRSGSDRSAVEVLMKHLTYVRNLLDAFGEKETSTLQQDQTKLLEAIETAKNIELALKSFIGMKYSDVKNHKIAILQNGKMLEYSLQVLIDEELKFEEGFKSMLGITSNGTIDDYILNQIVGRYLIKHAFHSGNYLLNKKRFEFCHYHSPKELPQLFQEFNPADAEYRDYAKDIDRGMLTIDQVKRPDFFKNTSYSILSPDVIQRDKEAIKAECGEGVIIHNENNQLFITFANIESAEKVIHSLYQLNFLFKLPEPIQMKLQISAAEYNLIKPYLKFKHVKPIQHHSVEDNLIDEEGNLTVPNMISRHEAVACNHNARTLFSENSKSGVEWFLDQLENPSSNRPKRIVSDKNRKTLLIQHSRAPHQTKLKRKLKPPIPLDEQEPITRNPPLTQYWRNNEQIPRDVSSEQGVLKNTMFAEKSSFTMLGSVNQRSFQGLKERANYFPIMFIFDINHMHTHGERFIWISDAMSMVKPWIENINSKQSNLPTAVTLEELQNAMQTMNFAHQDTVQNWNELLIAPQKAALCSIAVPGMAEIGDTAPLIYRLNVLNQASWIKQNYGIDVPIFVQDGKHTTAMYTEEEMKQDILNVANSLVADNYVYLKEMPVDKNYLDNVITPRGLKVARLKCEEQAILVDFFVRLTNKPCVPPIQRCLPTDEPSYIAIVDAKNTESLRHYMKSLALTDDNLKEYFNQLNYIGSEARESTYMHDKLKTKLPEDTQTTKKLLIRSIVLGHVKLLKELVSDQRFNIHLSEPLTSNMEYALHIAVKNGQSECVKALLELGCKMNVVNQNNKTPLNLIDDMLQNEVILKSDPRKLKAYQEIKQTLINAAKLEASTPSMPAQPITSNLLKPNSRR